MVAVAPDLKGRTALVTGGNSGIGEAICEELASSGAAVMVNYVAAPEDADALVGRLEARGADAASFEADISDAARVRAMFEAIDARWGRIDVVVCNAGIEGKRTPAWESEVDAWRRVIDVNLVGGFLCMREALARMVPRRAGVVISIGSVHEVIPWSGYSAYAASKAGLGLLLRTLAQEAAPAGVRLVSVAPGAIQTPINEAVWSDPESRADLLTKIPVDRLGTPAEVARVVAFLASDAASYITGSTVFVDGGMMLYPSFEHGG